MNNNLKLITTETFGELPCNFYRNMNDDIFLTREQIGKALGYSEPSKAIQKIHLKHKDRIESLCVRIVENRRPQNGGVGVDIETVYYTERGIMEICRWSRQPKADEFMDWVWDIVESYRNRQLIDVQMMQPVMETLNNITKTLSAFNDRISKLEESNIKKTNRTSKKYSYWTGKMFPKYQLLVDHLDITYKELYRALFQEFQNIHPDIELNQLIDDYCYENRLDGCFTLDAIEHDKQVRKLFEEMVDGLLKDYCLLEDCIETYKKTIFRN